MTTAERLKKVDEGLDKVEELNAELATSLYGGDTGYRGYYDEFWDAYQDYGNRKDYAGGFSGRGWNATTFKPKYDIIVSSSARYMFYGAGRVDFSKVDVKIDFSKCTDFTSTFMSGVKYIDIDIDVSGREKEIDLNSTFSYHTVTRIKKLIVDEKVKYSNTFIEAADLVELYVEGTIGNNINIRWSTKLNRASIESVINSLSPNTSGLTVTLSKTAVNNAFETSEGVADGSSSAEWLTLVATKPNWTISLA